MNQFNPVPWRKHEDLDRYALERNVPVTIGGKIVIADRVVHFPGRYGQRHGP